MKLLGPAIFGGGRRWQTLLPVIVMLAASGAASAWQEDAHKNISVRVQPAITNRTPGEPTKPLLPDGFQGLAAYPLGPGGPLGVDVAIRRTRRMVKPDRSNVDCSRMKCLALTFDDGPSKKLTPKLLKILKDRAAVATFFTLGLELDGCGAILKRAVANHNEIGNHTWSHKDLTALSKKDIKDEVQRTGQMIRRMTGQRPLLVRPPMGEYDSRVSRLIKAPLALWSIDPQDWRSSNKKPEKIRRHILKHAKPGRVVIMHDIYTSTIKAMPGTIDDLQSQGYVLVTMSELFGISGQNVPAFSGRILRHR